MSMTWQLMESFLKSRAGRRARSGIGSPALSMRIATGNVCGRRYVCSSWSAVFTSIMGVSLSRRLRGGSGLSREGAPLPLQYRRDGAIPDHPVARPPLAGGGDGRRPDTVRVPLSQRFQDLIDALAMREGATESEAYLEGWAPGPETERPGDAETVAREVAAELEDGFQDLVMRRFWPPR